ncbi:hypothetical protein T4B_8379 [Trichinella pseudospiralis]|uniref:Uncharacterized protein n=1 Tax=Trichinella pseudospiralis TaxID=6337 RepID=A0A0V1GIB8_TRIPS|nr:hypothetical protein T4B_8379 [Trichinella pseudospiralis]
MDISPCIIAEKITLRSLYALEKSLYAHSFNKIPGCAIQLVINDSRLKVCFSQNPQNVK